MSSIRYFQRTNIETCYYLSQLITVNVLQISNIYNNEQCNIKLYTSIRKCHYIYTSKSHIFRQYLKKQFHVHNYTFLTNLYLQFG